MNRNLGLSAGMAALLALFLHVSTPNSREGGSSEQAGGAAAGKGKTRTVETARKAESGSPESPELEGPWLATRTFFGSSGQARPGEIREIARLEKCVTDRRCALAVAAFFGIERPETYNVQFLLATVPDPMHTRLALLTDSSIQAIQKGADAVGWRFVAQWLPWMDIVDPDEKEPAKRRKEREEIRDQEAQPGALVFRRGIEAQEESGLRSVLVVFLVGETPTSGVNAAQFRIARAYMRSIAALVPNEIRILGPTFSGSFDSLARLVAKDKTKSSENAREGQPGRYTIRGTATSEAAAKPLQRLVDFRGLGSNSGDQANYFEQTFRSLGIPDEEAAVLVEDETSYGRTTQLATESAAKIPKVRIFRFPRDISHLRNAYREAIQSAATGRAPVPELDFSLKDTGSGEDSVPTFSTGHTPVAENAVLNEITSAIRRERIRMIQVTASNVLDLLFLARVLREQCPNTRLWISFADLLFVEGAKMGKLTGALTLSPYPLFDASNQWMGGYQGYVPANHPDANSEGVFNGTVLLLTAPQSPQRKYLTDYHWDMIRHPPAWLLMVDRGGFTPIKAWQEERLWYENEPGAPAENLLLPRPNTIWIMVSTALAVSSIAFAIWVGTLWLKPTLLVDPRFSLKPEGIPVGHPMNLWRYFYLFCFTLLMATTQLLLCLPLWRCEPDGLWRVVFLPALGSLLMMIACSLYFRRALGTQTRKVLYPVLTLCLAGLFLWLICCSFLKDHSQSFFFSFRALELHAGSSPAWPILAAAMALLLFCAAHFSRLRSAARQEPLVIIDDLSTALQESRLQDAYFKFNWSLRSATGFWTDDQKWSCIAALLTSLFLIWLLGGFPQMSSVDSRHYDVLSIFLQLAALTAVLVTCWEIGALWWWFHAFLAILGTSPLANKFIHVGGASGHRPLWVRRLNLQSLEGHFRSEIVLHDMALLPSKFAGPRKEELWQALYRPAISKLLTLEDEHQHKKTRNKVLREHRSLRSLNCAIARDLLLRVVQAEWARKPLAGRLKPQTEEKHGEESDAAFGIRGNPKSAGDLAQTFVALHLSSFLIYGVRQIRNLMWFVPSGFLMLVISLNAYSLQSPQLIGRMLLIVFLIIAVVFGRCLSGMERDPILSRISGTTPGELGIEYYLKLVSYVALPALGLMASAFPSISNFLFSWVEPTLEAMH